VAEPLFSVITIALNCAEDAERTARSVLAQAGTSYEYLIKDGGSTDGTVERLRALGVRVVSTPDDGIYDAMNQGLTASGGEYVVFMNAGDVFAAPDVLATVAQHIERRGRPDFLYGDIRSLVRHPYLAETTAKGRLIRYPERLGRFWLFRKMICHQAWFVRRAIYAAQPFDTNYRVLSDNAFLLDMVLRRRVSYAHVPSVVAVFDGGGLSTKRSQEVEAERERARRTVDGMRWINRTIVYPLIYPLLPERLRGRASGL
jgi:glycosyltransferase involved in cell wall biosynthesis